MELQMIDTSGASVFAEVDSQVFDCDFNEPLIHQVVVAYQSNARSGTRAQKNRATVRHSTKKPWKQKGTGRARAGMVSSPLWRGGGRAFPSSPDENFSQKINKKMYRHAMKSILSQLAREKRIVVVESFSLELPKTGDLLKKIVGMNFDLTKEFVMLLTSGWDRNLSLAGRCLVNFTVSPASLIDPVSLVRADKTLVTKEALQEIQERFL